jgi:predicted nicotinamide N-methyase
MLTVLETKELGIGYQVWPAGSIIASLLLDPATSVARLVRNKTILELGSGCGIAGLAAAFAGAKKVYLTDRKEVLSHLRDNVEINRHDIPANSTVVVEELEWGKDLDPLRFDRDAIDVIIASDCMYWASLYDRLVMTLLSLSAPKTLILLVHQTRRRAVERTFYDRLSQYFVISRVCQLDAAPQPAFSIVRKQPSADDETVRKQGHNCASAHPDAPQLRESNSRTTASTEASNPEHAFPHVDADCSEPPSPAIFHGDVAPAPEDEAGAAAAGAAFSPDAESGPVYLAYCRLRGSVTADMATAALLDYARDQADGGYLLRQLDLMADDIASIRPA